MPVEDLQMTRRVQREIGKRNSIDYSLMAIRSIHGIVYINGRVRPIRGREVNLQDEMGIVAQNIKRIPGVRDVVVEVQYH
ncbi:MAG: hypothetical protein HY321_15450 [Armatimonadetes bacterium]|nr:hypothetical protein [Armatimonadota bacterium]